MIKITDAQGKVLYTVEDDATEPETISLPIKDEKTEEDKEEKENE